MSDTTDARIRVTLLTDRHLYLGALKEERKAASWGSPTPRARFYTPSCAENVPSLPSNSGARASDKTAFNLIRAVCRTGDGSAGHLAAAWLVNAAMPR